MKRKNNQHDCIVSAVFLHLSLQEERRHDTHHSTEERSIAVVEIHVSES